MRQPLNLAFMALALDVQDLALVLMCATYPKPDTRLEALDKAMGARLDAQGAWGQAEARFRKLALR